MIKIIQDNIQRAITELQDLEVFERVDLPKIELQYPPNNEMGDLTSNIALALASQLKKSPLEIAQKIVEQLNAADGEVSYKVAPPGYINIYLDISVFHRVLHDISVQEDLFGKNDLLKGKKVLIEYTDPNPFKVFHIGHLMTNIIGESLSRLYEFNGAEVKRAVYQGDVGMHVAKSLWGVMRLKDEMPSEDASPKQFAVFLGKAYVEGSNAYEDDEVAQSEIRKINKEVYDHSNDEINQLYEVGRSKSLEYFEGIYKKLGTKFDHYFFESKTAPIGSAAVKEYLAKDVFENSDGAVVFPGEKYGLHTRVFLNKEGLPTYEAKDIGLSKLKNDTFPCDLSVIVTANEQKEYFEVVLKAMSFMYPEIAQKTTHVHHGMLRLTSGKMSSRKGNIISGESLLNDTIEAAKTKMSSGDVQGEDEKQKISVQVGVGALKYSILKQSIGKDIVYDMEKSLALEGSSGPYLLYTYVRTRSVLRKATELSIAPEIVEGVDAVGDVERLLRRFPEIVASACKERSPHVLCEYLFDLAQTYNGFYAKNQIIDEQSIEVTKYRLILSRSVGQVLKNGSHLLGISVPDRM